jgi:hypothetical protein
MPGYWNRPATGQSERKEPAYRQPEPWGGGGGGDEQRKQASQQANLDRIRREAEERNRQQQEINAEASRQAQAASQAEQRRQLAESLKAAGQTSGNLAFGLFKTAPVGTTDEKVLEYLKNPNVYYSTYGKGADAYTTAFQDELTGYGGLTYSDPTRDPNDYSRGFFTPFNPANYPDEYPGFGGGYNDQGGGIENLRYSSGYGGGYGGSGYAAGMPYIPGAQEGIGYRAPGFLPAETHAWMVNTNSPLYAARGGIMSLRR